MPAAPAPITVVVLAAGQGTRMRSKTIKVLHPVAGRPMVEHVLETAGALRPKRTIVVVGHQADGVRAALDGRVDRFALQAEQNGTGHAVMQAVPHLPRRGRTTVLILSGDVPTLRPATLRRLVGRHRRSGAAMSVLSAEIAEPFGYGRIVRDASGELTRIVEERDADPAQRATREINAGIYCVESTSLVPALEQLRPDNAQGEYYLPDVAHRLIGAGKRVVVVRHDDVDELLGVNTRAELSRASRTLYDRKAARLQASGVTIHDPARTWIDPRARIGRDTTIEPDVRIEGPTVIGEDAVIRAGSRISGCRLGRRVEIRDHCVLADSSIGDDVAIGPFAHLRPGTELAAHVKIGNFVELKKAKLGRGSKASHLSYLGDAQIGADCNIGAGTITCNYDGTKKSVTRLGRGVFIGSDTQLVAPVEVRAGAYVGAGTTVTQDVPAGALAVGRARQRNIKGWATKRRRKQSGD